ncbi:MAG: aminomethyl-transferring glycine dehydrogenase subunit GcvPA [Promethearchaeota archaeon]|jgi:glycine dehydrogenase subunit 1
MDFIPHDDKTIAEMLNTIGVSSVEDLFKDIPKDLIINGFNLPEGLSEPDVLKKLRNMGKKNTIYSNSFLGAGCYYHYIPTLVDFVISRSEFYTSYTPYQAEASQGYLQAIYEYQSIISRLTKMDVTNASMYDGSTALAEAAIMATIITRKDQIIILDGVHPEYIEVVKTYCWAQNISVKFVTIEQLDDRLTEDIAAVLFQSPNFFGDIEDVNTLSKNIKEKFPNCLLIQCMTDPTCLGILKPPGETDVDIFVAEGQSFGIPPSFGGPGLGIFASKKKFLRKIPGRLVGKTTEINGKRRGFLLTLQAREQHIRREKASSNICTNQALCSLSTLIYLVSLGKTGLREIATQNAQKAHYVKEKINNIPGYVVLNKKPTYNEFIVKCSNVDSLIKECKNRNLLPPLPLLKYYPKMNNVVLVCVTESNSSESIESFLNALEMANNRNEGKN